jgi:FAD/FMN-containing dehydrogenase/Fe-S oxidoreductase
MEIDRQRIQADLRGLIEGEVYCDDLMAQLYATDASVYEISPLGVVRPRGVEDVVRCVQYAVEHGLALYPRGAGSGLAGESLGRGLILDFSRFMRRILSTDYPHVTVQPGVILAELNRTVGQAGYLFGPDPATRSVSTIGSALSVDSSGSHFPKYGSAGDKLVSLQVVLASGEVVRLEKSHRVNESENESRPPLSDLELLPDSSSSRDPARAETESSTNTVSRLAKNVYQLLDSHRELIDQPPWGNVARGAGYRLERALGSGSIDLTRLISGAEGTLAIITEATILLDLIPSVRGVAMLFFDRMEGATRAALEAGADGVSACDLLDRRLLEIARETYSGFEKILPRGAEAMLLVEHQGDDIAEIRAKLSALVDRIQKRGKWFHSWRMTADRSERDLYWRICRRVIPRLYRLKGSTRPVPFIEDVAIPPTKIPEFIFEAQNVFKAERVTATVFGHVAHGQLHIRPFLDLSDPNQVSKMERLAENLYEKVWECGGTISGEHAIGLSRNWFSERQFGPRLELCRNVKRLFDPGGILNPGKFPSDHPQRIAENLRPLASVPVQAGANVVLGPDSIAPYQNVTSDEEERERLAGGTANLSNPVTLPIVDKADLDKNETSPRGLGLSDRPPLPLLLNWSSEQELGVAARTCNGCGRCRTTSSSERMCPMFRVSYSEEASPRAKANLMRAVFAGRVPHQQWEADGFKKLADLCFHCHQCRVECPASVDIPKMMTEAKSQYVATNGLSAVDRWMTRLDWFAKHAMRLPSVFNWCLGNRRIRWFLEKTTGLAQGRKLPALASKTFMRWAIRQKLHRPSKSKRRKVLYFVDHYANWHNPLVGRALVEVLKHHGIEVYVPTEQSVSHIAKIAAGDVQTARRLLKPTVRMLAESIRQGYEIVATEPAAALCLKHEYRHLWDDEDTQLISQHSHEACTYLLNLHHANELELDFRPLPLSIVYHQPCHVRALDPENSGKKLLELIPGVTVQDAAAGCSGMAGIYGLKKENYRTSLRIGWNLISTMQQTTAQIGATECSSCKLQMEQAVSAPTIHPIAILAHAYGRVPEVAKWIQCKQDGLLVQ